MRNARINTPPTTSLSRKLRLPIISSLALCLVDGQICYAEDSAFKPAVIFQGKVQQGSYVQLIDQGIQRFEQNTGIAVVRVQLEPDNNGYLVELEKTAKNGFSPIVVQESNAVADFPEVAKRYPSTRFISLDVAYHVPNILGLTFNHAEGAYVIGFLAGRKTRTNKVGFVGGMDVPVINEFLCGYQLGAMDSNPNTTVTARYINQGAQSWQNPKAASEISKQMLDAGIDIIFPVAGYSSTGVAERVKRSAKGFSFGIDYDYAQRYPSTTLASLEKKVDLAVYAALMQLKNGIWNGSHKQFGVKQGVISITVNHSNTALTESDKHAVEQLLLDLKGKSSQISQKIDQHCTTST